MSDWNGHPGGFGRIPNKPDARDWKMSDHLSAQAPLAEVDAALEALQAKKWVSKTIKEFAAAVTKYLHAIGPTPTPDPVPPVPVPPITTPVVWEDKRQLDQGDTGHCVGFGWAQWGNTAPVEDAFENSDGHAIYYECKVFDGEPLSEVGSNVRSGAQAMQIRGKLTNYVFATTVADIVAWVSTKGPIVVGTDWLAGMDELDSDGNAKATGSFLGGHCYLCSGYDPITDRLRFQNSWGSSWGKNGYFYMSVADFTTLFANLGDACAALEI